MKYGEGYENELHLLELSVKRELELIEMLECSYSEAFKLNYDEVLKRAKYLQFLLIEYGDLLSKKSNPLYFMIGNMESNYRFVLNEMENEVK